MTFGKLLYHPQFPERCFISLVSISNVIILELAEINEMLHYMGKGMETTF